MEGVWGVRVCGVRVCEGVWSEGVWSEGVRRVCGCEEGVWSVFYLIFDVDGPEHLNEVSFGVLQKLLHLHVGLQLVKLLNLHQTISLLNC